MLLHKIFEICQQVRNIRAVINGASPSYLGHKVLKHGIHKYNKIFPSSSWQPFPQVISGHSLVLQGVTRNHSGNYRCKALDVKCWLSLLLNTYSWVFGLGELFQLPKKMPCKANKDRLHCTQLHSNLLCFTTMHQSNLYCTYLHCTS